MKHNTYTHLKWLAVGFESYVSTDSAVVFDASAVCFFIVWMPNMLVATDATMKAENSCAGRLVQRFITLV